MATSIAEISQNALGLPAQERAALIDKLFDSIDVEIDPARREEIEQRWAAESERRIDAVDKGELNVLNGLDALKKLRRSIKE